MSRLMQRSAMVSIDGRYRYDLRRVWAEGPCVAWVLLNPSTADAEQDDPTVRRLIGYSRDWGYGNLLLVNLYAWRATDPKALREAVDPVGLRNESFLRTAAETSDLLMVGWGAHAPDVRAREVAALFKDVGAKPMCLGVTKSGAPRHPLYMRRDAKPRPWEMVE